MPFLISPRLVAWADFIAAALNLSGVDIPTAGAVLRAVNNYVVGTTRRQAAEARSASQRGASYQAAETSYEHHRTENQFVFCLITWGYGYPQSWGEHHGAADHHHHRVDL